MTGTQEYNWDAITANPALATIDFTPTTRSDAATAPDNSDDEDEQETNENPPDQHQGPYRLRPDCLFCLEANEPDPGRDSVHHVFCECRHADARGCAEEEVRSELVRRTNGLIPPNRAREIAAQATALPHFYAGQVTKAAVQNAIELAKEYRWVGPAEDQHAEFLASLGKKPREGYRPGSLHIAIMRATDAIHKQRMELANSAAHVHNYNLPAYYVILRRQERYDRTSRRGSTTHDSDPGTPPSTQGSQDSRRTQGSGPSQHPPSNPQPPPPRPPPQRTQPTRQSRNGRDHQLQMRLNAYYAPANLQDADAPGAGEHNCCINAAQRITTRGPAPDNRIATHIRTQMIAYATNLPPQHKATLGPNDQSITNRMRNGPIESEVLPCLAAVLNKPIILVEVQPDGHPAQNVTAYYPPLHTRFNQANPLQVHILAWQHAASEIANPQGALAQAQVICHSNNHYRTTIPLQAGRAMPQAREETASQQRQEQGR